MNVNLKISFWLKAIWNHFLGQDIKFDYQNDEFIFPYIRSILPIWHGSLSKITNYQIRPRNKGRCYNNRIQLRSYSSLLGQSNFIFQVGSWMGIISKCYLLSIYFVSCLGERFSLNICRNCAMIISSSSKEFN